MRILVPPLCLVWFALLLATLSASNVPNPFYPNSFATLVLQDSATDVIGVTQNSTHVLVVDSESNMHAFQYFEGKNVTHKVSSEISSAFLDDVGFEDWTHWRKGGAMAVVMHPNVNGLMYAIQYNGLSPKLHIYVLNTTTPFNQLESDPFGVSTSDFFLHPLAYPRLATNISFNYLYIGIYNDGTKDTSNNASGFYLAMHSIYRADNPDFFKNISSTTKRVLSMDFFCNEAPVVCLWTSPTTVEEYFLEDLSFRRNFTFAAPPLNFDSSITKDMTTYSSYYFHRSLGKANEFVLHRRNRTDVMAVATFPYQVNFAYDIPNYSVQLAPDGVAVAVTTNSSVSPIGLGSTEIVICQYDSSLNLKASTVLSTTRQDNMTKFFVQSNGGFIVIGSTSGNLSSPASNSASQNRVFAIQFEPLVVNATISSKPMLFTANESIEIKFKSVPSSLTSVIPTIVFGQRNCTNVHWNSSSLRVQIPTGVGGPYEIWVLFNSPIHFNPKLRIDGYAYDPPTISSISPVTGPSVGFNLTINASKLGVPNQDPVVVTIGSKLCLNTQQLDSTRIRCTVPPGTGRDHRVVVSVGPISNSTQPAFISYDPPNVFGVTPSSGPTAGGNSIFIIGDGFGTCNETTPCNALTAGILSTIGNKPCSALLLYNDTHLNCTVPEGSNSSHPVSVEVLGQTSTSSALYSYQQPYISIVIPASLVSTNPSVYIEGENFGPSSSTPMVKFVETNTLQTYICPNVTWLSHTAIRCVFTTVALPLHSRFNITVYVGDLNNENTTFPQFRTGLPNSPPLLQPLAVSMEEDTSLLLDISITDSEGDVVQLYVVTNPLHGRLYQWSPSGVRGSTIDANSAQVLVTDSQHRILYVPFSNYFGGDNFLILAKDNQNETSPIQSVNITISSIPDPPVVVSDDLYMDEDSVIAVQFRAIDPDDTDNLNICILSLPSAGILLVQNSTQPNAGNLTITNVPYTLPQNTSTAYFIPAKDENGTPYSSLKFKANDGQMDSLSNGTVNIYVRPVNDAPIFNRTSLNLTVYEDTPVIFQFNISDVDEEDTLSIRISDLRLQGDLYVSSSPDDLKDIAKFKDIAPLGEGSEIRNPPFRLLFVPRLNFYSADFDSATGQRINLTYADGKSSFSEEIAFSILPVNDPPKLSCDYPFIELPAQFTTGGSAAHEIQFTVTDVDDRNFTFTLIDAPPVGFLFHGSNDSIIQPGEKFDGSSVLYNSNSSGGRYPFGNFTVSVQDMNGRKSNSCTYTFSFTCPPGKYNNIFKTTGPICDACPEGAICSPDGSQPVRPALGFWRSDQNTTYLPCLPREACPGYAENTCALGYEGTRCGQCSRHYYRFNNSCQKCDDSNLSLSLAVIGGALAAALLFFAVFKYVIGGGPRFGIISILINFIQTILLLQLMRLNWPSEFHEVLNRLSFLNFNIELTSPECFVSDQYLNFSLKMRLSLLIPFVILGLSAVAPMFDYILQILEQYWRRKRDTPVFQPLLMFRVFNSGLAVAFVHITSNALALFDCSYEDDGYSYLDADTSLRCYEEWWVQDLPIAAIATCAYVIGVPLYFAIICYNARKCSQDPSRATRFSQFCNSILSYDNSYQTKFQYFTVFQLLQKLFMVLISTFFTRYTGLQIILTLSLLFVSFQFLREYSPYSYKRLNHLEALSHVCAMIVLALGLPFHLDQFRSSVYQQILMVLIILVVCSFIVFTILVCVYDAIQFFRHRSSSKVEVQAKSGMLR